MEWTLDIQNGRRQLTSRLFNNSLNLFKAIVIVVKINMNITFDLMHLLTLKSKEKNRQYL